MTATSQSSKSGRQLLTELPARYRGLSPLCTIYRATMSFQRESADISPDYDDNFEVDLNAFEIGAAVTMAGIGVASVGITTAAAPTVVGVPSLLSLIHI